MKVVHKGLIFICVPLVIQLTGIVLLQQLFDEAQSCIDREAHSRQVLALTDEVNNDSMSTGLQLAMFLLFQDPAAKQRRMDAEGNLISGVKRLDALTKSDPAERELVAKYREILKSLLIKQHVILAVPQQVSSSYIIKKNPTKAQDLPRMFDEYRPLLELHDRQQAKVAALATSKAKIAQQLVVTLGLVSVATITSLLVLAWLFGRDISTRLKRARDNSLRLMAQDDLLQPAAASDEIFDLDCALNAASLEIKANEEFRRHLVSIVTHELRTPLSSLQGTLELYCLGAFGSVPADSITNTRLSLNHLDNLLRLINNFLDLERIKSGKWEIQCSPCTLVSMLSEVLDTLDDDVVDKLSISAESGHSEILADSQQLANLLRGLLSVATSHADPESDIRLRAVLLPDQETARVSIEYTGKEVNDLRALTDGPRDSASLAEATDVPVYLQLSMCKALANLHGGELQYLRTDETICLRVSFNVSSQQTPSSEVQSAPPHGQATDGTNALGVQATTCHPWRFRNQLGAKGLVLLGTPLLFALILPTFLFALLGQVKVDLDREHKAWKVFSNVTLVDSTTGSMMLSCCMYNFSDQDKWLFDYYNKEKLRSSEAISSLKAALASSGIKYDADLKGISRTTKQIISIYDVVMNMPKRSLVERLTRSDGIKNLERALLELRTYTLHLLKVARQEKRLARLSSLEARAELQLGLQIAGAMAIILCLGLVVFMSAFITKRLAYLMRNTKLLSTRKGLLPALQGADELSFMDSVLHEADSQLREFEEFKRQVAFIMIKQLSAPIASIELQLEQTLALYCDNLQDKAVSRIRRAKIDCSRLQRLLQDLRSVQVMTGGLFDLKLENVSTAELIDLAVASVDSLAARKNITITQPTEHITIDADRDRLVQVLINLLSNAIKFSSEGETIAINLEQAPDHIVLSVQDNGRGMTPEFQQKLFNAFEQMEQSDSMTNRGTGLGLFLCKSIMEQHGGKIEVESSFDRGSIFKLSLPHHQTTVMVDSSK